MPHLQQMTLNNLIWDIMMFGMMLLLPWTIIFLFALVSLRTTIFTMRVVVDVILLATLQHSIEGFFITEIWFILFINSKQTENWAVFLTYKCAKTRDFFSICKNINALAVLLIFFSFRGAAHWSKTVIGLPNTKKKNSI
ncbi:hypothetical protein ACJX0J_031538, partial [Zea mays]